jgi:membrane-associated protein
VSSVIDFVLHADKYLLAFSQGPYGPWLSVVLFAIIFAETGLVVTPFLPGDSLLFATGALAATGVLNPLTIGLLLFAAAFIGNAVNYAIGRSIGPRIFAATDTSGLVHKVLNREHLQRAHAFFEQYGGKAIIMGRFVPIVRTFVPFVAGAASMPAHTFGMYNFIGAAAWVGLCLGAGYAFGNVPVIKNNFTLVTLGIVFVSILPMLIEIVRHRRTTKT